MSPAYNSLLTADRNYHVVFLVAGGLFIILLLLFSAFSWMRFRHARRRTFERRTFFSFGMVSSALAVALAVVFAGNVTSVVNPGQTLSGTAFSRTGQAWLRSGRAQTSPLLQHAIDDRLAWQRPKAVICAVLLAAFATLSVYVWRTLIHRSTTGHRFRIFSGPLLLGTGILSAGCCLLLMLMVIGNAEGALAPLFPTVIYG